MYFIEISFNFFQSYNLFSPHLSPPAPASPAPLGRSVLHSYSVASHCQTTIHRNIDMEQRGRGGNSKPAEFWIKHLHLVEHPGEEDGFFAVPFEDKHCVLSRNKVVTSPLISNQCENEKCNIQCIHPRMKGLRPRLPTFCRRSESRCAGGRCSSGASPRRCCSTTPASPSPSSSSAPRPPRPRTSAVSCSGPAWTRDTSSHSPCPRTRGSRAW